VATREQDSALIHNWKDIVMLALDEFQASIPWLLSEEGRLAARDKFLKAKEKYPFYEPDLIKIKEEIIEEIVDIPNYIGIRITNTL
jgi:hypothetical protein